jgi:hypothetical protein
MSCNHDSICIAHDVLPVSPPLAVDDDDDDAEEKIPNSNGNRTIKAGNMVQSKTHRKLAKLLNPSSRSFQEDVTFVVLVVVVVVVVVTQKQELAASDSESSDAEESAEEWSVTALQYKTLCGTNDDS